MVPGRLFVVIIKPVAGQAGSLDITTNEKSKQRRVLVLRACRLVASNKQEHSRAPVWRGRWQVSSPPNSVGDLGNNDAK